MTPLAARTDTGEGDVTDLNDKQFDYSVGNPKRPSANQAVRTSNGASRASKFRQADVARALKGAQKAKLQIAAVRIEPDGTIIVIPGTPEPVPSSERNPWDDAT